MLVTHAEGAGTMQYLQVAVGRVIVADQAQSVRAARDGGANPHTARAVESNSGGAGAGHVCAMRCLQVAIVTIVVADQAQPIGPQRDRRVLPNIQQAVESSAGGAG